MAPPNQNLPTDTDSTVALPVVVSSDNGSNNRQLREYIQRMRATPSQPAHVDAAYREYAKMREQCAALVRALLSPQPPPQPPQLESQQRQGQGHRKAESAYARVSVVPWQDDTTLESLVGSESAPAGKRGSADAPSVAGTAAGTGKGRINWMYLVTIREWRECLENLAEAHR